MRERRGGGKNRIVQFVGPAALTPQAQPVIHQKLTDPSNVKYPSNPLSPNPFRLRRFQPLFKPCVVHQEFLRVFLYTTARTLSFSLSLSLSLSLSRATPTIVHLEKDTAELFVPENLCTLQLRRIICDRAVSMIKVSMVQSYRRNNSCGCNF